MELYFRFPDFKTKVLTFSYDDGVKQDHRIIEILNKYGLKATFNLNSGLFDDIPNNRISESDVVELYKEHEIAIHTLTHPHLNHLTAPEIAYEILKDRENLERITERIIDGMAYPYYLGDTVGEPEIAEICGITYARTIEDTFSFDLPKDFLRWHPTCHHDSSNINELIEKFIEPEDYTAPWTIKPKIFYIWGHSYEFDRNDNWEHLEDICHKLSCKENIWYATNGEIRRYKAAFDRLQKSSNGAIVYNPTDIRLYAVVNGSNITFDPGETVIIK